MKCIAFADLHAHNFKDFNKSDDITGNTRLTYIIHTLDVMKDYCIDNNIKTILFAGDLFHSRKSVETNVINHIYRKINQIAFSGIHIYMLVGNHDQVDNSKFPEHSLEIFKGIDNITVLDRFIPLRVEDTFIFPLPFTKDIEYSKEILEEYKLETNRLEGFKSIILGHCGISGAKVGTNNHIMMDAFNLDDLGANIFDYGIFGHYHKMQFLTKTFAYAGSPLQHNAGDANNSCGFILLDTEKDIMKHIPIESTPKFITVESLEDAQKHPNDYVNIQIPKEQLESVVEQLEGLELSYKLDVVREYENDSRINVDTSMSEKQIIETYCKDKEREDAIKTLLDIIREVN